MTAGLLVGPGIATRAAPPAILAQLREIDPAADLVYAAEGVWMLGVWRPNKVAMRRAARALDRLKKLPIQDQEGVQAGRIAFYELAARGYRPVWLYEQAIPDSSIVEDFRERDFNWRTHGDKFVEQKIEDAANSFENERSALLTDAIGSESRSLFRFAMKRQVSRLQGAVGGLRSSARKLIRSIR